VNLVAEKSLKTDEERDLETERITQDRAAKTTIRPVL